MIRLYLLTAVFSLCFDLAHTQIVAGIYDGLKVGQKGIQLNAFAFNFGDFNEKFDSIDFDEDGRYDANFITGAYNIIDYNGALTGVFALHSKFEMLIDSLGQIIPLALGDTIKASQNWSNSLKYELSPGIFKTDFWGVGGHIKLGLWESGQNAFAGFRVIIESADTLYGWMKVTNWVNASNASSATLKIESDWAIQFAPSSSVSGEPAAVEVDVTPNPAHDLCTFKVVGQNLDRALIRIFDVKGNLLRTEQLIGEKAVVQMRDIPTGIYLWELNGKGWRKSGKLVKE